MKMNMTMMILRKLNQKEICSKLVNIDINEDMLNKAHMLKD